MSLRERIIRVALLAFPSSVRATSGEEMLGTVLDVGRSSRLRFGREVVGLAWLGQRTRSVATAKPGPWRLIADGVCLAGIWLLCLFLAGSLGDRLRGLKPGDPHPLSWWSLAFLTAALVLTMLGRERLGGATALVFWCAVMLADSGGPGDRWRAAFLVPAACFAALLLVPRAQPRDTRRLYRLGLVALIAVASSLSDDAVAAILVVALLTVVPLSLAVLHIDPRPAIASAVCVSFFGIAMAQDPAPLGVLGACFLIATPVVVVIAVARTRRLNASHRAAT